MNHAKIEEPEETGSVRKALLISVGGSLEPVKFSLLISTPDYVWYFCSSQTLLSAQELHQELGLQAQADYIVCTDHESLGSCYEILRSRIPGLLSLHGLKTDQVSVDYTCGTKTMSAALVLAATELFSHFLYVGGGERSEKGRGTVLPGHERRLEQPNPWEQLAVREIDLAANFWNNQQFGPCSHVLREIKSKVPMARRPWFDLVITLADALKARQTLALGDAAHLMSKVVKRLERISNLERDTPKARLLNFARSACHQFEAAMETAGRVTDPEAQLAELLDNALLTAEQGRHEDAAARLYRFLELRGQAWLEQLTDGAFRHGQLRHDRQLPSILMDAPFVKTQDPMNIKLGLESVFRALALLAHPTALRVVADLDGVDADKSVWRNGTRKRNQSILAHGMEPVGEKGFREFADMIFHYLHINTTDIRLKHPVFDPAWLDLPPEQPAPPPLSQHHG